MKTTEIYVKNPKDIYKTAKNLLRKLENESPNSDNAQMVIQFGKDFDGMEWKMFVYYGFTEENDFEEPVYFFSFQDENYEDTLTEWRDNPSVIISKIMLRANMFGCQWIAVDYDSES